MVKNYYPRLKNLIGSLVTGITAFGLLNGGQVLAQPTITSVVSASRIPGSTDTINGTNFNAILNKNIVRYGATKATLLSGSTTRLVVTVPLGATNAPITVTDTSASVHTTGFQQYPNVPKYDNSCFIPGQFNFAAKIDLSVPAGTTPRPYIAQVGDLDGDGLADLVTANHGSNLLSIFRNTSTGPGNISQSWVSNINPSSSPANIKFADFDGDGRLDMVVAFDNNVNIAIYRNTSSPGSITFSSVRLVQMITSATPPPSIQQVTVGDFDNDGRPDIAVAAKGIDSISVIRNQIAVIPATLFVAGSFSAHKSFYVGSGTAPGSLFASDINGDGKTDIVTCNAGSISVFADTSTVAGSIGFSTPSSFATVSATASVDVIATDLNGDGKPDVAVTMNDASYLGTLSVFRNTSSSGAVSFGTRVDYATSTSIPDILAGLTSADFDGDGKTDIVATQKYANTIYLFRNVSSSGTIALSAAGTYTTGLSPTAVTVGDMDNDKRPDIIVGNSPTSGTVAGDISIFRNIPIPYVDEITGPTTICMGSLTDTLRDSTSGGYWTSTNPSVAVINATTGAVLPIAPGVDTAIYTFVCQGDTASVMRAFTVAAAPTVLPVGGGSSSICSGTTSAAFTDFSAGGTWSVTPASVATITSGGVVHGISGGTATVSYTVSSGVCGSVSATSTIIINQTPSAITGDVHQCVGTSDTLGNAFSGGTWTSSPSTIASVTASTGIVRGVTTGTATITYTLPGGCYVTRGDTVSSTPSVAAITGPTVVCTGSTITLATTTTGGSWSSANNAIASVNSFGVVTGNSAGTVNITYSVTNSCATAFQIRTLTVNTTPSAITGTFNICSGTSTTLGSSPSGGSWSSSATGTASIGSSSGIMYGGSTSGSATITYTLAGCSVTQAVTVNPAPPGISGSASVCVGSSTTLTDGVAGTWSSSNPAVASIESTTGVTYGVATGSVTITFTSTAYGCGITSAFTVNPLPAAIGGPATVCAGSTITLTESTTPGTWSSSATSVATVVGAATSATVFGSTGVTSTSFVTITFTSTATGCQASTTIAVEPVPAAIAGSHAVCVGSTDTLSSATTGGTWSVLSGGTFASVTSGGVVIPTGTPGTATIKYALTATGCFVSYAVTVNPVPAAITGLSSVCPGYAIALNDATTGGTWSSADTSLATVVAGSGSSSIVTGRATGSDVIYYTLSTGCRAQKTITILPAPAPITGSATVCAGFTTGLIDTPTTGGIWTSSAPGIARVDTFTGLVHGAAAGTAVITYTTSTYGCSAFLPITVLPILLPSVGITMSTSTSICAGTSVTYTASPTNGGTAPTYVWKVNRVVIGTGATLTYTPNNGDTVRVVMTNNLTCPAHTRDSSFVRMTVNPLLVPSVNITTGIGDTVCTGSSITFNPNPVNGGSTPTFNWTVNGVSVWTGATWTYYPANGDVIRVLMHTSVTCRTTDTVSDILHITVSPYLTPAVTVTGSDTACEGYPVVLHANPANGGFTPTYQWQLNGTTAIGTGSTLAYMASNGDAIRVKMTSSFPCVVTPTAYSNPYDTITVVPVDTPVVTVIVLPGYILSAGSTAWFAATVVGGGSAPTFQWYRMGGIIPGATLSTYHTNVFASGDSFICRVTNHDFCNGITGFDYQRVYIGDNVGVKEVNADNSNVTLMPNPNNGSFTIKADLAAAIDEDVDVEITNMLGQVIYKNKLKTSHGSFEEHITLDGTPASGMYMINVHSEHLSKVIRFALEK